MAAAIKKCRDQFDLKNRLVKAGMDPDHLGEALLLHVLPNGEGCSVHLHNWQECAQEIFLAKLERLIERLEEEGIYPVLTDLLALCAASGIEKIIRVPKLELRTIMENLISNGYRPNNSACPDTSSGLSL